MINNIQITGQSALSSATVRQANNEPNMNPNNDPDKAAVFNIEAMVPLSLGSVISPTYACTAPAPTPILNPIRSADVQRKSDE